VSTDAGWLADPAGRHELRYWDGAAWTEHVADAGTTAVDPAPPGLPDPSPTVSAPRPPAAGEQVPASGRSSWKDKFKQAAQQGRSVAEQAKAAVAEQQAKRAQQWAEDPNTLWFGESKGAATSATGMSKARYRITKDRVYVDTGLLGVKSEQVPLWAVRDVDVRQSVLQRGKDIGDVILRLEDPSFGMQAAGAFDFDGIPNEPGTTTGEVLLDNIEGPYRVHDLLMPLISEARAKKLRERQTQYMHVNPGMVAMQAAAAPPPAPAPAADPVDLADQLRKLASLRDEGILTDEEFAAQKARLLGG
jgi:hypothetical protein